jgi:SAM-dependent methyltransferase
MQEDKFINIENNSQNIDIYFVRSSIKKALVKILPKLNKKLLDIGCGKMPYRNYILKNSQVKAYIGLDIENAIIYDNEIKPDFFWDGVSMPFQSNNFDCAIGTEVLEHCPFPEIILKETNRVIKQGGVFFFTVPFIWNLHEVPHDEYRFTPFSLKRLLESTGFENIEIYATGGWHAALALMLGLWIKRAPLSKYKRKYLMYLIKPIYKFLIKKDSLYGVTFTEGQMITGLYGTATKK